MAMEISSAYNSYASTYTNVTDKANSSSAARAGTSDYLAELQKKYPKLNIQSGYANANMGSGSYPNKIDVTIAPNILAEMETKPETAEKWEKTLAGIPAAANWAASAINAMNTGSQLLYIHYWIDENGNMGACSASGPSPDEVGKMISERKKQQEEQLEARLEAGKEKRERMEKMAEKKAEKKTLQMREAKIAGNDVQNLTEKLVAAKALSKSSAVYGTTGVDIKV